MSRILGFGVNQWGLYESGQVEPSRSNLLLVQLVKDPKRFLRLLETNYSTISDAIGDKKMQKLHYDVTALVRKYELHEEKAYIKWVDELWK